ncbi:MAG: hypothetical protein ACXVO9_08410 [Bacteroidia bacterium]
MNRTLQIIVIAILVKLLYFGFFLAKEKFSGKENVSASYQNLTGIFNRNDASWYEKISTQGYPEIKNKIAIGFSYKGTYVQSAWAFFPFYPMLNSAIIKGFGCSYNDSALFLSVLFSLLAFVVFYKFNCVYLKNEPKAFYNTLLLIALPFNYYFSMFYTEAIFFTFLIVCFLSIYYKREWLLFFLLIPLTLLRPNGIILTLPLYLYYLERNDLLDKNYLKQLITKKHFLVLFYFSSALASFILFGLYQKKMTGEFLAFSIAQKGWYKETMFPLLAFFRRGDFATQFYSFYTIVVCLFALYASRKLSLSFNILVWVSLILPLCAGSITSMQRYIVIIFPLVMFLGGILYESKFRNAFFLICITLQLFLFYFWLNNAPFSF